MVGVGCNAPMISTASAGSPISSSASRSAVLTRSSSSWSWRPPGNEISPAWRRRSSRRRVKTACSAPSITNSGTSTAASMRPCTSSAAASAGSSRTRRSRAAHSSLGLREFDKLDVLVEHHLAVERAVDRALGGNHAQALDLLLAQVGREAQREAEAGGAAALGGRVLRLDLDAADVPALALRVHLHGDRGTRREAGCKQLLGARRAVLTALVERLVCQQAVLADLYDVLVRPCTCCCGLHEFECTPTGLNNRPVGTLG